MVRAGDVSGASRASNVLGAATLTALELAKIPDVNDKPTIGYTDMPKRGDGAVYIINRLICRILFDLSIILYNSVQNYPVIRLVWATKLVAAYRKKQSPYRMWGGSISPAPQTQQPHPKSV